VVLIECFLATLEAVRAIRHDGTAGGVVHYPQVLAYAWDRGYEVQLVNRTPVPAFPGATEWGRLIEDGLQAIRMVLAMAGAPVRRDAPVAPNLYARLLERPREELNSELLMATFPQLALDRWKSLDGETVFHQDAGIMSGAHWCETP
jgi:hypothetical protein